MIASRLTVMVRYEKHVKEGFMNETSFPGAQWANRFEDLEDETKQVTGMLSFDGNGPLHLDIPIGVLMDWPREPIEGGYVQFHAADGLQQDQVFGYSQKGDYCVLRDVSSPGPSMAAPGYKCQSLYAQSMLVSKQPIDPNPIVASISLKLPGLREWVGRVPFDASMTFEESELKSIDFHFSSDSLSKVVLFDTDAIRVSIDFTGTKKGSPLPAYSFEFESDCQLSFDFPESNISLDDALDQWVFRTVDFLAFCMGFRYSITEIDFNTIDGIKGRYYAPLLGVHGTPGSGQIQRMPFPLSSIEDTHILLGNWFTFEPYARNASKLLVSLMYDWKMPLDTVFLISAQAFEAASRIGVDDRELDDEQFEKKLNEIKESNLSSKTRKWVLYKLKNAKWKTANQLVDGLFERLKPVVAYVVPDVEKFKREHREHRDSFTHRRDIDERVKLTNEDLYWHTGAVRVLAYAAIASALGISPEASLKRLQESSFCGTEIMHSRRLYVSAT